MPERYVVERVAPEDRTDRVYAPGARWVVVDTLEGDLDSYMTEKLAAAVAAGLNSGKVRNEGRRQPARIRIDPRVKGGLS